MKRILVVEDDLRIATALRVRLESAGFEVTTAADGLAGLRMATAGHPDLIISDIWMPVGLGLSLAQRLDELKLAGIPIIFITAGKQPGLKQAAQAIGAAAYFEKPYDPEELLKTINRLLGACRVEAPAH